MLKSGLKQELHRAKGKEGKETGSVRQGDTEIVREGRQRDRDCKARRLVWPGQRGMSLWLYS